MEINKMEINKMKTKNKNQEERFEKINWRDRLRVLWYSFTIAFFPTGPA